MIGNDANLDILQLALRLTGTTEVANILAQFPHWDKGPRWLHLPTISKDLQAVPDAADHINPQSWRANLSVKDLTLSTCWKCGRHLVEDAFPFVVDVLSGIDSIPNTTILAPCGTPVFNITLPADDIEDDQDSDNHNVPNANAADVTAGLRELEDATVDAEWGGDVSVSFSKAIDIDGGGTMVNKAHALALWFKYDTSSSSTDCLLGVCSKQDNTSPVQ
jgi:hypothetical protein